MYKWMTSPHDTSPQRYVDSTHTCGNPLRLKATSSQITIHNSNSHWPGSQHTVMHDRYNSVRDAMHETTMIQLHDLTTANTYLRWNDDDWMRCVLLMMLDELHCVKTLKPRWGWNRIKACELFITMMIVCDVVEMCAMMMMTVSERMTMHDRAADDKQ